MDEACQVILKSLKKPDSLVEIERNSHILFRLSRDWRIFLSGLAPPASFYLCVVMTSKFYREIELQKVCTTDF